MVEMKENPQNIDDDGDETVSFHESDYFSSSCSEDDCSDPFRKTSLSKVDPSASKCSSNIKKGSESGDDDIDGSEKSKSNQAPPSKRHAKYEFYCITCNRNV
jgi:hypothetical protein